MTEPLVDAREMLRGLHSHKIEFVVFGALAICSTGTSGRPRTST
jgi:hypothetical protein